MGKFYEVWDALRGNEKLSGALFSMLAGVLGALIAIFSGDKKRSKRRIVAILLTGLASPGFIAPLVFYWLDVPETLEPSVSFACGLFGIVVIDKIADFIKNTDFKTIISIILKRGK